MKPRAWSRRFTFSAMIIILPPSVSEFTTNVRRHIIIIMPTIYNTQSHDTVMTRAWRFNEKKTYTIII